MWKIFDPISRKIIKSGFASWEDAYIYKCNFGNVSWYITRG